MECREIFKSKFLGTELCFVLLVCVCVYRAGKPVLSCMPTWMKGHGCHVHCAEVKGFTKPSGQGAGMKMRSEKGTGGDLGKENVLVLSYGIGLLIMPQRNIYVNINNSFYFPY